MEDTMLIQPGQGSGREWREPWMWVGSDVAVRNAYGLFRFELTIDRPGVMNLAITADSWCVIYLDGIFVQRGPVRGFHACYPFENLRLSLAEGRHVLAVLVHHLGDVCATYELGRPGLRMDGDIGGRPLGECGAWRCRPATSWRQDLPERMSHFGFWEDRNFCSAEVNWAQPDFDDRDWMPPYRLSEDEAAVWKHLVPRDIPPFRYDEVAAARCAQGVWEGPAATDRSSLTRVQPGTVFNGTQAMDRPSLTHVQRLRFAHPLDHDLSIAPRHFETFDFGRTITGYLRTRILCEEAETELIVAYDEFLQPSGAVDAERSYARFADRFVLPRGETIVEGVQPRGYRYATLDVDKPARIESVWVLEERYAYEDARREVFASTNPDHAPMFTKDLLTADLCTLDTFVDCPNRERVHFQEAVHPAARSALFGFGDSAIVRRSIYLGAQSQFPDGSINSFSPSDRTDLCFVASNLLWMLSLLDYIEHTGDEETEHCITPVALRMLDRLRRETDSQGIILRWHSGCWWDWTPCEMTGTLLLNNAFYLLALDKIAALPGLHSRLISAMPDREILRAACHERFWDAERRVYRTAIREDGTPSPLANQFGNAMAVLTGICPPEGRRELLQRITRPGNLHLQPVGDCNHQVERIMPGEEHRIIPFGMHYPASFLVEAMFRSGMDVEAHHLMDKYWGPYLKEPVFPEVFIPGHNSFLCHDWGCGVAYLLQAYVAGLRPATPGWQEILWEPHPGPLTQCRTEVPTQRGLIRAEYRRDGEHLHLRAGIPEGSRLRVRAGGKEILVSDRTEWEGIL